MPTAAASTSGTSAPAASSTSAAPPTAPARSCWAGPPPSAPRRSRCPVSPAPSAAPRRSARSPPARSASAAPTTTTSSSTTWSSPATTPSCAPLPDGTYEITDLGSHNGTYLNGRPVTSAPIGPGDIVGIGHSAFCLVGDTLQEYVDTGEVSLDVQDLTVAVDHGRRTLLDHVSFPVGEKCLLAVVGPSGAGKSTLLNALTGQRPADHGTVLYDGRDLYRDYAELRQRIGLVPQDDILHAQLTVRSALSYAAELRFPQDTAKAERRERVDEVIRELGLEQRARQPVHSLSGGQRKRVSVALELLTKPSLLFLDEPTSGLDPGMDRSVMHMLRGLADDGRTIIVVTHSVLSLDVCDRLLVLAPGGRIAYYGPPEDALAYFGFTQWPEAFEAFERDQDRDWAGDFRSSAFQHQYVDEATAQPRTPRSEPVIIAPPPRPRSRGAQLGTLIRRYGAALAADRTFLVIMVALPFVMGAMARALAGSELTRDTAMNALLILCVGGVLTGAANAVRELVKERVIYQRERAVGLSRSAYLMSKVVVLGTITVVQAVVLTLVALLGVDLNAPGGEGVVMPPLAEITLAVALLAFTAMMLGLLVSALVRKEEVTMPLLVLLAIVQVVFCGALLKLDGVPGLEQLSWLVPSRWALGAMAGTIGLARMVPGDLTGDPLFEHSAGVWLLNIGMLVVLSVFFGFLVSRLLRRHEPAVMRK
ncbi:ABC-type multidrug transport system ATPase subunit/ABC-type multidrug transport system permease subunit [Streptomyces sp. SAI-135]|nr:ABC-type multidrug transport system ATPase subunit/ABC-type multidrug transport system permease subunit [Streptomyces sp. SAI-135]